MYDYIYILYSCKKNLDKTNKIYNKIYDKIINAKVYIIYGDDMAMSYENENYRIIDDKYIVLNVKDDYENLNHKTIRLIQTINIVFPTIKGMFKCDDDVIINLDHINKMIHSIGNEHIDYCGNTNEYKEYKCPEYKEYNCYYCGGPLYFLSKKSIECFNDDVTIIEYEDVMVAYHLKKFNIFPDIKHTFYFDDINCSPVLSYHNKNHYDEIYVIIHGGLGNQLFQLACAMKMAEKYNKKFILNTSGIIPNPHQKYDKITTLTTIQALFPDISICDKQVFPQDFYTYKEKKNDSFFFAEEKIDECFNVYNNVVLHGYFINYKYIPMTIFEKIKVTPTDERLLIFDFTDVYFIHIRLGDYLKHKMYQINLKPYYNYCINQLMQLNINAKFIICTNQYDDHLQNYIKDFPKNIKYKIQDRTHNDSDTLYIMSSCCGAICANSTLSFMGSVLQKTEKKKENIYMPYPFVNFTDGFNPSNVTREMYPEWCTIYNTLNDKIII